MNIPHLGILISPTGEEFYSAYGPMTKDIAKATRYVSAEIARRCGPYTFGHSGTEFWECERENAARCRKKYRGWTSRIEPAPCAN